jgi:hypothetical protein
VGNLVWHDVNYDGHKAPGESGLDGVTVALWTAGPDGVIGGGDDRLVGYTNTVGGGGYSFGELPVGQYYLAITNPPSSYPAISPVVDGDGGNKGGQAMAGGLVLSGVFPLAPGTNDVTRDFGFYVSALVTGHLYYDTNADGQQDSGEPNLTNVAVYVTNSLGGIVVSVTDSNGNWIASVPPGLTTAKVNTADPSFIAQVAPIYQQTEGTDPTTVTAVAGMTTWAGNDGYTSQYVDGYVYVDSLISGTPGRFDVGVDTPIPFITVYVTNSLGAVIAVATDTNGYFRAYVTSGLTGVKVDQTDPDFPAGLVLTIDTFGEGHNPSSVSVPPGRSARDNTGYIRSSPTLAAILSVTARASAGVVTVRWVTAAEAGTVAYDLQRQLTDGNWTTVNADPVFAWNSVLGASYDMVDAGAKARQSYRYQILEYLELGGTRLHGPYEVAVTGTPGVPVAITSVALVGGQVRLTWQGEAGAHYLLERSLSGGGTVGWAEVPLAVPGATTALVPVTEATGFFRVFRVE